MPARVNCGGSQYTDGLGNVWAADNHYTGGNVFNVTNAIANTTEDGLYQYCRYGSFSYSIPVSSGTYTVRLHFAELYWPSTGSRVFDVFVNGVNVADNFDIVAAAGANFTAHVVEVTG